jgi:hypothetical protein|tara:strand:- start:5244 stop:6101 length:858 start_codon:yes stop_codon:yes gene_type:complete
MAEKGLTDEQIKQQLVAENSTNINDSKGKVEYKFPTEVIDLPSKGKLYPDGHPLQSGTIELKYMTAREEDILTSQNLIQKGVVLDRLLQALIVTPCNYDDILIGDKNAIMVAARVMGYGSDYKVEIEDPYTPGEKQETVIDLQQLQDANVDWNLIGDDNSFDFDLPLSKRTITFKLLTHGDEGKIAEEVKAMKKNFKNRGYAGVDAQLSTRLKHMITAVDGDATPKVIREFVDNQFLSRDTRTFREQIKKVSPDIDMTFTFVSDITGQEREMSIPLGVNFFWPGA